MQKRTPVLFALLFGTLYRPFESAFCGPPEGPKGQTAEVFGERCIALVKKAHPNITIVCGSKETSAAARLRDGVARIQGTDLPIVEDARVLAPGTWRLADEWAGKNLLLIGNIHTNRAFLALYARLLAGASARYPGSGRYEIRTLFQPLHRGADVVVIGASDAAGISAGIDRFLQILAQPPSAGRRIPGDLSLPALLELGSASGPEAPRPQTYKEFYDAVAGLYWNADLRAGLRAKEMLLADMARRPHGLWGFDAAGHYEWEGHYRALLQLIAAGFLNQDELQRVEERLLQNALENSDSYGVAAVSKDSESICRGMDRHLLSAVVAQFVILEYLDHVANVPDAKKAAVHEKYQLLCRHIEALLRRGRFRTGNHGNEGLDCVTALAGLYLHFGEAQAVEKNIFRNMADYYISCVDNLGYHVGQDSYITCRPGCHYAGTSGGLGLLAAAYFHQDGQYRWIAENMSWFKSWSFLRVRVPPEHFSLPDEVAPAYPARYAGLSITPMDPFAYEVLKGQQATEAILPIEARYDQVFDNAVFRDGFRPEDAFLMLQGINAGAHKPNEGFQGNAIVRYTELGSLLLFHNTQKHTSWARNVVSISRGEHDPQASACVLQARLRGRVVSAVSSLFPQEGGAAWRRDVVRRRGGYFVVLDKITALADDAYHLTCRWRSFHPGHVERNRAFQSMDGMNGTRLHIVASEPVAQEARLEPRDGAAEPTVLRQTKSAELKKGQSVSFQNLIYATNDEVQRRFDILKLSDQCVMVNGQVKNLQEIAAIGTENFDPLRALSGKCRLWHVANTGLAAAGARELALRGCLSLRSEAEFNLTLFPGGVAGTIENPGTTPLDIALRAEPGHTVKIDSKIVNGSLHLEPGEHSLQVAGVSSHFDEIKTELQALWDKLAESPRSPVVQKQQTLPDPWREVWRYEGIRPPLRKHFTIKASAQPETTVGDPSAWVDRRIHYTAPSAGWAAGVEGAAILDLYQEVDIHSLRVVGSLDQFKAGEMAFEVALSNDGFRKDQRRRSIPRPSFETHYAEMAHYMYTYQFPVYVLPIGDRARYVRLSGRWLQRKDPVLLHEIEVVVAEPQPTASMRLFAYDFLGNRKPTVLVASGERLVMFSADGKVIWEQKLESPFTNISLADVNSDGKTDIITFTLAERLHVFNPEGSRRFVHDARQGFVGGHTELRPGAVGAWRPDAKGHLEYYLMPHVRYVRISPEPELKQHAITLAQGALGGKHAFTIPDVTGDGREDLAIVGLYGMGFGVVDSRDGFSGDRIRYCIHRGLTGHSSGNMELPVYFEGTVVQASDGQKKWMGVVALNPGGINFFSAPKLESVWSHFNHPPNTCFCLHDLTGDGVPELLIGREDGFVTQYAITDGKVMNKAFVGAEVRAIAALGEDIVVGTHGGLVLLTRDLRKVGFRPGAVQSIGVLESFGSLIVAHEDGVVVCLNREKRP